MNILNEIIERRITTDIIENLVQYNFDLAIKGIASAIDQLYAAIPDNKRISYGRVYTIKVLSKYLFSQLSEMNASVFQIASNLFLRADDYKCRGVALGMLSFYGQKDYSKVLPYFEKAAMSENFDDREMAQMFFRRLIKKYPEEMKEYLLSLVNSEEPKIRRFVAETLRPVQENRWFYNNPDFPLSVLNHLFKESAAYPRTAVGNNLSDLARRLPDLVYELVEQLVNSGDKNSYWIAYRACRNLVKQDPMRVMDLLKVDEYKYKKRIHKHSDYQRN